MAGRILNRRTLRQQAEEAEQNEASKEDGTETAAKPKKPAKAKAAPKPRKPRAKKAPPRIRARWAIFNNSAKQVAIFDYRDRVAADEKLADLLGKNKGLYYMQIIKEPMPEPEPEPVAPEK